MSTQFTTILLNLQHKFSSIFKKIKPKENNEIPSQYNHFAAIKSVLRQNESYRIIDLGAFTSFCLIAKKLVKYVILNNLRTDLINFRIICL